MIFYVTFNLLIYISRERKNTELFFILLCQLANHYRYNCGNQTHSSQHVQLRFPSCMAQSIDILNPVHM